MPEHQHAAGEPDEVHAQRQQAEQGAAGGAADARPEQHVGDVGRRVAQLADDGRHPLEDVIERSDVREVGEHQQQRERQVGLLEHVRERRLRRRRASRAAGRRWPRGPCGAATALILASAFAGCLRHSQETDSGTQNHTTGIMAAVAPAPSSKTTRQLWVFSSGERIKRGEDVAEWIADGHEGHPELAHAVVGELRRGGIDGRQHAADAEAGEETPQRERARDCRRASRGTCRWP